MHNLINIQDTLEMNYADIPSMVIGILDNPLTLFVWQLVLKQCEEKIRDSAWGVQLVTIKLILEER
jgi:hypothetical protein